MQARVLVYTVCATFGLGNGCIPAPTFVVMPPGPRPARPANLGSAMLDHRAFLHDPDSILAGLKRRGIEDKLVKELVSLADQRRQAIQKVEKLRHDLNAESARVQEKAKAGDKAAVDEARGRLKSLKAE